ncbi:unnamed protein product, partial [Musa acuminata var. zebrina]
RGSAAACVGGNEWYLFSLRDLKYATGQRTNRATMSGYWKATGKDKPVTRKGLLVGMRKTLVFYQGRAPKGKKTKWVMHEFRMEGSDGAPKLPFKPDWALCRVFCNNRRISTMPSMESSHESSGSQSLPALMDNCITFGQTPFFSEGFEQVPCFSSLSPNYVSQCQDFVLTKCLAQTGGLPELNSGLNQLTGDRRDSRTVLNYFTKFEGDPKGKVVPQGGYEDYLTQSRLFIVPVSLLQHKYFLTKNIAASTCQRQQQRTNLGCSAQRKGREIPPFMGSCTDLNATNCPKHDAAKEAPTAIGR